MTIDLTPLRLGTAHLPEGTVVEVDHDLLRFVLNDGRLGAVRHGVPLDGGAKAITRVFVPVPDGMDVDTATRILTDHDQWQPITGAPTEQHLGKRVRVDLASYGSPDAGQWYVLKGDAGDEDAELIEALAKVLHDADDPDGKCATSGGPGCNRRAKHLAAARAAIAASREARP